MPTSSGAGRAIKYQDLCFIEGEVSAAGLQRLAAELLSDPVAQTSAWRSVAVDGVAAFKGWVIETALRPSVTDPVAEHMVRYAQVLGIDGVERAAFGQRYEVCSKRRLSDDDRLS